LAKYWIYRGIPLHFDSSLLTQAGKQKFPVLRILLCKSNLLGCPFGKFWVLYQSSKKWEIRVLSFGSDLCAEKWNGYRMSGIKKIIKERFKILEAILQIGWKKRYPIYLDYPINPKPRYGYGLAPHPRLLEIISSRRDHYQKLLSGFAKYHEAFNRISLHQDTAKIIDPIWVNGWFPPLDVISLYGMLAAGKSKRYFEVGSGNSTKVAYRAINDQKLETKITSIDPHPRAEIDSICDKVIRQPVEDVALEMFKELQEGDILLVDNSHRVFQNSDVNVCFLDILPILAPGVIVAFHDIYLPLDYNKDFGADRHYSEQYLLAAYILAEGKKFDIIMPNTFVGENEDLLSVLSPVWDAPNLGELRKTGSLFWIKIN
jgi:hypothetical protein